MGKIFDQWTVGEVNTFSVFPTTIQDHFPDSSVKKVMNQPAMQETLVQLLGQEDPLEKS